jgi:hypothetical protein
MRIEGERMFDFCACSIAKSQQAADISSGKKQKQAELALNADLTWADSLTMFQIETASFDSQSHSVTSGH